MKCCKCGKTLQKGDTFITNGYPEEIICSDCYEKIPYTAFVFNDKCGNFIGLSEEYDERAYDE